MVIYSKLIPYSCFLQTYKQGFISTLCFQPKFYLNAVQTVSQCIQIYRKFNIFDLMLNFKLTKLSFMEDILYNKCRHELLNYTYHKPQIIRDITRILLCPKILEEILEIEKNDGSCCHWCWSQTKLQCPHVINHSALGLAFITISKTRGSGCKMNKHDVMRKSEQWWEGNTENQAEKQWDSSCLQNISRG